MFPIQDLSQGPQNELFIQNEDSARLLMDTLSDGENHDNI